MTLHGTMNINGRIIGRWSAQRIATAEVNTYACEVHMLDQPIRQFEVQHRGSDGAAALVVRVLSEGACLAQESERRTPTGAPTAVLANCPPGPVFDLPAGFTPLR